MNAKWMVRSYLTVVTIIGALALYVNAYELVLVCAIMGTIVATY